MHDQLAFSLIALLILGLGACQTPPPATSTPPAKTTTADLRLYVFDCGQLTSPDISMFGITNEQTSVRTLFVPCYLIEHPQGRLLFDLGLPEAIAGKGEVPYGEGAVMVYHQSLVNQLAAMSITPQDIDWISYSHSHFDHVGSANRFPGATLLIQDVEYDAAFNHADDFEGLFVPDLYEGLRASQRQLLKGSHDVFGDGRVRLIDAPGHTPGHQVLWLDLENTGPLVLSGDLYHFEVSRKLRSVPIFNFDKAQSLASMTKIEELLGATGATLWIEHNQALADTLRKAPGYYD